MTYEHVTVRVHDHPQDPPPTPQGQRIRHLGFALTVLAIVALLAYVAYVVVRYAAA